VPTAFEDEDDDEYEDDLGVAARGDFVDGVEGATLARRLDSERPGRV
jgi:hypothetical protein